MADNASVPSKHVPIAPEAPLYFSRRMQLYTTKHVNGRFLPGNRWVSLEDKTNDLKNWEVENQLLLAAWPPCLRGSNGAYKSWTRVKLRGLRYPLQLIV